MFQDLRHAVRLLLQAKGWTAVVVVSLALGIGANTALFSAVNELLLQTISVRAPDELVRFRWVGPNQMVRNTQEYGYAGQQSGDRSLGATFSYPAFQALREGNETLVDLFAAAPYGRVNVVVDGEAELASAFIVSGNYFEVLGVPTAIGRALGPSDDEPSAPPAVMISYGYWQRRFGGDPSVVGKSIRVNNLPVTIVGVTGAAYEGVQRPGEDARDLHLPLALDDGVGREKRLSDATYWWLEIMGRLKPGVTEDQVEGNLDGLFQAQSRAGMDAYLASLTPEQRQLSRNQGRTSVPHLFVDSGRRGVYDPSPGTTRDTWLLSGVVALVLLLVCANVANLLLSRATAREGEIAVRSSLGATRARLLRQLLTEGVLLSALGGVLGLLVALWGRSLLPFGKQASLDGRVLLFAALVSLATGCAFSLLPALRATRSATQGRRVRVSRSKVSRGLLALQVAACLVLLTGSGVLLKTLRNLREVDVGFDPTNLLLFRLDPTLSGYDEARTQRFFEEVRERLAGLGGVRAVSFSRTTFLAGSSWTSSVHLPGSDRKVDVHMMMVSPEFFETLGVRVLAGRVFGERDTKEAPRVAIINSAAARDLFRDENALGRRFGFSPERPDEVEIVGLVGDVKYETVRDEAPLTIYVPFAQREPGSMTFEVKTTRPPMGLLAEVRETVRSVDPNVPLMDVSTQAEQIENRFTQERSFSLSYTLFGTLALLLAALGLFGLASYEVSRRTGEIGVRMAIGARQADVLRMVVGDSAKIVLVGILLGLAATLAAGRAVESLLFGVESTDLATMVAVIVVLGAASAIAAYLPARRAIRVDPAVALQYE